MKFSKLNIFVLLVALSFMNSTGASVMEAPFIQPLWDMEVPGAKGSQDEDVPSLFVYLPESGKSCGTGIIICPGGAYTVLAIDHEGQQVARWLNRMGIAAFVLKYRLGPKYQHPIMLLDAQRAVRMVRAKASQWGIATNRIGVMGFSAGGHLASTVGTHFDYGKTNSEDSVDHYSCRPDFMVLIYPVISMQDGIGHAYSRKMLLGDNPSGELIDLLSNEKQVNSNTPPAFLVHSSDDTGVIPDNSILFYKALIASGVIAELHLFGHGSHGFGLAPGDESLGMWPQLLVSWLRRHGFLNDEKRVSVKGEVLIDGKLLNRGWIVFEPLDSKFKPLVPIYISEKGRFSVRAEQGPCVGLYKIRVLQLALEFGKKPSIDDVIVYDVDSVTDPSILFKELKSGENEIHLDLRLKR